MTSGFPRRLQKMPLYFQSSQSQGCSPTPANSSWPWLPTQFYVQERVLLEGDQYSQGFELESSGRSSQGDTLCPSPTTCPSLGTDPRHTCKFGSLSLIAYSPSSPGNSPSTACSLQSHGTHCPGPSQASHCPPTCSRSPYGFHSLEQRLSSLHGDYHLSLWINGDRAREDSSPSPNLNYTEMQWLGLPGTNAFYV